MQKTWTTVLEMFEKYTNGSWHIILLAVALLYLLLTIKKKKENVIFIVFSLLFAGLYLCPYTADLIMKNFIGRTVYWRMFWILPSILIIAYAGALFISRFRAKGIQAVLLAVMVTVIGVTGTCVYFQGHYTAKTDLYKLPSPTVSVCRLIKADAMEQGINEVHVVVPNHLVCYIRQYDASFYMPYGRNAFRREDLTQTQAGIFSQMSSDEADAETINHLLREEGINYFVWDRTGQTRDDFEAMGYVAVGDVKGHRVYRLNPED